MSYKKPITVLITAAGCTTAINIIQALRLQTELPVRIIATDVEPLASGLYLANKKYLVPKPNHQDFIPELLDICKREGVKVIFPSFSAEFPVLAEKRELLAQNDVKIAISPPEVVQICENKRLTHQFFKKYRIPTPHQYSAQELESGSLHFPLFLKPLKGRSSINSLKITDQKDLEYYLEKIPGAIVQDYAPGIEHTVDILSDLQGKMIIAIPRIRLATKSGLAVKSVTVANSRLVCEVERIANLIGLIGVSNIQCMVDGERICFIEVNCRMPAGGMPLDVAAGVNMPLLVIKMLLGEDVRLHVNKYKVGITMVRYWNTLFVQPSDEEVPYELVQ